MNNISTELTNFLNKIDRHFFNNEGVPDYILDSVISDVCDGISLNWIELDLVLHLSKTVNPGKKKEYLYLIFSEHGVKIGKTKSPKKRIHNISTKLPFDITGSEYFIVENMSKVECELQKIFKEFRLNGEWFNLNKSQIDKAKEIIKRDYSTPMMIKEK